MAPVEGFEPSNNGLEIHCLRPLGDTGIKGWLRLNPKPCQPQRSDLKNGLKISNNVGISSTEFEVQW